MNRMIDLNENQKRYFLFTFQEVDRLLTEVEQILQSAHSSCFFSRYLWDITPDQEKAIIRQIVGFREQIGRTLHEQQIPPGMPLLSARRALLTVILFADLAIEDLKPKKLKGCGEVSWASSNAARALL